MRAVIYNRVSSEKQAGETRVSIGQQIETNQALCEKMGFDVVGVFTDQEKYRRPNGKIAQPSGKYDDRPAFQDMLKLVERGDIDVIVSFDSSRIGRHLRVLGTMASSLDIAKEQRNGRGEVTIWESSKNSSITRLVLSIMITLAQEENESRVRRIKMGKVGTLRQGFWPGLYNRLGYSTEKAPRGKRIILGDPAEINTVQTIFNLYDKGLGVTEIRTRLIAEGHQQKGNGNGIGKKRLWGQRAIQDILNAEDYTGKAVWKFNDGTPSISIDIPQIITPEQFARVQRRMKKRTRQNSRNTKGLFLLQGLVVCGDCGGTLCAANKSRYRYKYRDGKQVWRRKQKGPLTHRYFCALASKYPDESHSKPYTFDGPELDNVIWRFVVDNGITNPDRIIEQVKNRQAQLQAEGNNLDGQIAQKQAQVEVIDHDRMTYARQLARGKMKEDVYDSLIAECDQSEQVLKSDLEELLTLRDNARAVEAGIDYTRRLLADIERRLPEIDLPPAELDRLPQDQQRAILEERQTVIQALCDKIYVSSDLSIKIDGLIEVGEYYTDGSPESDYIKILYTLELNPALVC